MMYMRILGGYNLLFETCFISQDLSQAGSILGKLSVRLEGRVAI